MDRYHTVRLPQAASEFLVGGARHAELEESAFVVAALSLLAHYTARTTGGDALLLLPPERRPGGGFIVRTAQVDQEHSLALLLGARAVFSLELGGTEDTPDPGPPDLRLV